MVSLKPPFFAVLNIVLLTKVSGGTVLGLDYARVQPLYALIFFHLRSILVHLPFPSPTLSYPRTNLISTVFVAGDVV